MVTILYFTAILVYWL